MLAGPMHDAAGQGGVGGVALAGPHFHDVVRRDLVRRQRDAGQGAPTLCGEA
jgi:hypothetical protein